MVAPSSSPAKDIKTHSNVTDSFTDISKFEADYGTES